MTDEEAVRAGHAAQREYSQVSGAFDRVRGAILQELSATPVSQPDKVLKLHMAVQNLTAVEKALQEVITNGVVASQALAMTGLNRPN